MFQRFIYTSILIAASFGSLATGATGVPKPVLYRASQLSVKPVAADAGAGNRAIVYALTNKGPSICTLFGYPGIQLRNATGHPITAITVTQTQSTYSHQGPLRSVTLAPGQQASFEIAYSGIPAGRICNQVSQLDVTPPHDRAALTLKQSLLICGSTVRVTPIVAGIVRS